jgi:hypothetical protein
MAARRRRDASLEAPDRLSRSIPVQAAPCLQGVSAFRPSQALAKVLQGRDVPDVFRSDVISELLGERVEQIIGRNWYGYVDHASFQTATGPACRKMTDADASALAVLRNPCADGEWAEASFDAAPALSGCFEDRRLVAASNLTG